MTKKLLLVDDDPRILKVLSVSFKMLGYEVVQATDGEEAERAALAEHPDLIVLDVMMPKKDGFAVCRDLKVNPAFRQVPILLLTAKSEQADVYSGLDCGADAYMTKPYDARRLEALVAELLEEAASGRPRVAWTGLPSGFQVEEEYQARLSAGAQPLLVELGLESGSAEAFARERGRTQLRDLIRRLGWFLHEHLEEICPGAVLGQRPDDRFLLILGEGTEASILATVVGALEEFLRGTDGSGSLAVTWRALDEDAAVR